MAKCFNRTCGREYGPSDIGSTNMCCSMDCEEESFWDDTPDEYDDTIIKCHCGEEVEKSSSINGCCSRWCDLTH